MKEMLCGIAWPFLAYQIKELYRNPISLKPEIHKDMFHQSIESDPSVLVIEIY